MYVPTVLCPFRKARTERSVISAMHASSREGILRRLIPFADPKWPDCLTTTSLFGLDKAFERKWLRPGPLHYLDLKV
jgi:hypothetical protein